MAKKRKKGKEREEEYEFKPPEFNEQEFLKKELRDTRAALVTIGFAVLLGIIAGGITSLSRSLVGVAFLVVLVGIFALRYVYKLLKIDTSGFHRRNWVGNIGSFFFVFLAIWVLLINMPFMDLTNPTVDNVIVWVNDGTNYHGIEWKKVETLAAFAWVPMNNETLEGLIHATSSYTINITARIADSGGIATAEIAIGTEASGYRSMTAVGNSRYEYVIIGNTLNPSTGLLFYIHVQDKHGNEYTFKPDRSIPVAT